MKVRITQAIAGVRSDTGEPFSFAAGEEHEIGSTWAKALLEGGVAEAIADRGIRKAIRKPAESRK